MYILTDILFNNSVLFSILTHNIPTILACLLNKMYTSLFLNSILIVRYPHRVFFPDNKPEYLCVYETYVVRLQKARSHWRETNDLYKQAPF